MSWKYGVTANNAWKYVVSAFNAWKYVVSEATTYGPADTSTAPLFWLSGISGNEVTDRSGNGRNFTITNKDFATNYFPYKSAATISAPADDAVLIAADINNFLYDSGGDPNDIPVVSFFQNIDYEDKLFCRHIAQVVDGNDVETSEPYVTDIVLYASVLTGNDLTLATAFYVVPSMDVSAKWCSLAGNDTTGDGTKATPYLTLDKANDEAGAGGDVYIETGAHDFGGAIIYPANILATGFVTFTNLPANYAFIVNSVTVEGLVMSKASGTYPFFAGAGKTAIIKRCYISEYKTALYTGTATGTTTMQYCVINTASGAGVTFTARVALTIIDTCYIGDSVTSTLRYYYTTGGTSVTFKNNTVNSTSTNTIVVSYDMDELKIYGNTLTASAKFLVDGALTVTLFEFNYNTGTIDTIDYRAGTITSCEISYNEIDNDSVTPIFYPFNGGASIFNNIITVNGAGGILSTFSDSASTLNIYNNRITAAGDSATISMGDGNDTDTITGAFYNNYYIQTKSDPSGNHGLQVYGHKDFVMYHNYIEGVPLALIYKGDNHDFTGAYISHNIVKNGKILIKGGENINVINNTVCNDGSKELTNMEIIINNGGDAGGNVVKNNIFITDLESGSSIGMFLIGATVGTVTSDYNLFYSAGLPIGWAAGGAKDWSEWQGLGYDANGDELTESEKDALFTDLSGGDFTLAVGSQAIEAGESLAAAYDDGLDSTTDWGDADNTPAIVTKQQTAPWDCGAFVL